MDRILISEPTFLPLKPNGKGLIGIASVLFNGCLSLNSISVYLRPDGSLRLVFPNKVLPNGRKVNIFYPIRREVNEAITRAIEDKYKQITATIQ